MYSPPLTYATETRQSPNVSNTLIRAIVKVSLTTDGSARFAFMAIEVTRRFKWRAADVRQRTLTS